MFFLALGSVVNLRTPPEGFVFFLALAVKKNLKESKKRALGSVVNLQESDTPGGF